MAKGRFASKLSYRFNEEQLDRALKAYGDDVKKVMRPAAFAGSDILYTEMKQRTPVGKYTTKKTKRGHVAPGTLRRSIYQVFSKDNSGDTRATFQVGPNKRVARHWWLIEYGHWSRHSVDSQPVWVPPNAYIRPTWEAKGREAVAAIRNRMRQLLNMKRRRSYRSKAIGSMVGTLTAEA